MALEVERAMAESDLTIIEAGTGTGKTLAYLLPALLSEKVTVVSTGLKNLQDQIYRKDIVFIKKYFGLDFRVSVIKGRDNYVCRRLLRTATGKPNLLLEEEGWKYRLAEWADDTLTGLWEDAPASLAASVPRGVRITSSADSCRGSRCFFFAKCFYYRNLKAANGSAIILVNHDIFIADLIIKNKSKIGNAGLLPDWDAAILDEAHLLEDKATKWLAVILNTKENDYYISQLMDLFERGTLSNDDRAESIIDKCLELSDALNALPKLFENLTGEEELYPADDRSNPSRDGKVKESLSGINQLCMSLSTILPTPYFGKEAEREPGEIPEDESLDITDMEKLANLSEKLASLQYAADFLADGSSPDYVYQVKADNPAWGEGQGQEAGGKAAGKAGGKAGGKNRWEPRGETPREIELSALPLEAGKIFGERLRDTRKTVVLTSATLSTGGDFNYMKNRFDFGNDVRSMALSSPFDYGEKSVLYVPGHIPRHNAPDYPEAFLGDAVKLLNLSKGRALILFTSYKRLNEVSRALPALVPWTVLVQSQYPKMELLERFRTEVSSVLLATSSFWQGVDVPGESLSVVMIDHLPFERPNLPLHAGRCRLIEKRGGRSFNAYSLPQMTLTLRQGLGRLIRSANDRGVLAIYDTRVINSGYRKAIQKSLPPSKMVHSLSEVEEFLADL
jgi:ATP-dependent DNA helicase DinG